MTTPQLQLTGRERWEDAWRILQADMLRESVREREVEMQRKALRQREEEIRREAERWRETERQEEADKQRWVENRREENLKTRRQGKKQRGVETRKLEGAETQRQAEEWRQAELEAQRVARIKSAAETEKQQKRAAWIKQLFGKNIQLASVWVSTQIAGKISDSPPGLSERAVAIEARYEEVHENSPSERIPPELFDSILFYVHQNYLDALPGGHRTCRLLLSPRSGLATDSAASTLRECVLVCHYWATQCRRSLFSGTTLIIRSSSDMDLFKHYATQGCPRLQPIHQLISSIYIVQGYTSPSFCHRLHALIPVIGVGLFKELWLVGPVSDHIPQCQLSTPHWSIPSSIVTPPSLLPFRCINILEVHLPSLRHVSKYIRHLAYAAYIRFENLTWDLGATIEHAYAVPHPHGARQQGLGHGSVSAGGCTDNIYLCLYATLGRPDCPLLALQDNERDRVVRLLSQLWQLHGNAGDLYHMIHWDRRDCISIGLHSGRQCLFTFQLSFDGLIGNIPMPSDIHLSGFRSTFYMYEAGIDCHAVTRLLRSFHTLRVIHFDFVNSYHVEAAGLSWTVLLAPPLQNCEFILTPAGRDTSDSESEVATVDPLILDPTGCSWENVDDIVSCLLQHPRSQHAIQRTNEKRIRWQLEDLEVSIDSEADSTGSEADTDGAEDTDWVEDTDWEVDTNLGWDSEEPASTSLV